ncbi:MAG: HEAT repeat domain-containing protein [Candidatus Wallbacteria bacterium]|nr:HEAT repeat domain-containing protein [Candidatus Wallbacteria bacterium]
MGINLLKLAEDLTHPDEDIRLLAMRTLCRLDMASTTMSNLQLLQKIKTDLEDRIARETGDAQFFAQKAYEHLKPSFGFDPPPPARPPPKTEAPGPARPETGRVAGHSGATVRPQTPVAPPAAEAPARPLPPPGPLRVKDPEAIVRALKALCQQPDPAQYADLLEVLARATDPRAIAYALQALSALGSATDLPTVSAYFSHGMPEIRANAVAAYSRLAPPAALLPGLAGGLSGDKPVELLRRAARDSSAQVRARVVQALEYQAHPQVPDLLSKLSQDTDTGVAQAAARALTRRRSPVAPPPRAAVPAPAPAPGPAVRPPPAPVLRPPPPSEAESSAAGESEVPPKVLRLRDIESGQLATAKPEVLDALESAQEPIVVSAALSTLSVIGSTDDVAMVRRFLGHKNDRVRANAVEAIERLGTAEQVLTLVSPLANDRDNRVRGNALKALGKHEPASVLPHVEYMLSSADVDTRATALFVLGTLDSVDTLDLLSRVSEDESADLRRKAAPLLGKCPAAGAEPLLQKLAADSDPAVATAAKSALAARKPKEAARPRVSRAAEAPDLPPRRDGTRPSGAATVVGTAAEPQAPNPPPHDLDFGKFDPEKDSGEPAAPTALGREMDSDLRENAPSRLMLAPEMQDVLDGLYDQLYGALEAMGRRIWKSIRSNLINDVKLVANSRAVQKAEGLLEAHLAEVSKLGFLKGLFSKREVEHKRAQVDFQLSEAYRKLGELAVEQAHQGGRKHADLAEHYTRVEQVFAEVRKLKEGKA